MDMLRGQFTRSITVSRWHAKRVRARSAKRRPCRYPAISGQRRKRRFPVRANQDPVSTIRAGILPCARRYLAGAVQSPTRLPDTAMFIVSLVFVIVMRIWPS